MKSRGNTTMRHAGIALIAAAMLLLALSPRAEAKQFNVTINGDLLNQFVKDCGVNLDDTFDSFCPSGACACLQYDDPDKNKFAGNLVGRGKGAAVQLHFTRDGGAGTGNSGGHGVGCNPVYGELQLPGSKDVETIFFVGSICEPQGNRGKETMRGGWSIDSSSHNLKAFGTLSASFGFFTNTRFTMTLTGHTQ